MDSQISNYFAKFCKIFTSGNMHSHWYIFEGFRNIYSSTVRTRKLRVGIGRRLLDSSSDNIKAIFKRIWCCYKGNSFTSGLLKHLSCKHLSVNTAQLLCFMLIGIFRAMKKVKSGLIIPEFSGHHSSKIIWLLTA